jgi:YVTN family beta-propeller protein
VAKIDVAKRTVVGKTKVGIGPIQVFVNPNNKYLLVANQGTEERPSATVSVIDTKTFSVVKTVKTGKGAHGVVIEPSSRYAYITNIFGNTVAVLELATQKVTATVSTGLKPNGISFSSLAPSSASAASIAIKLPDTKTSDKSDMKH